MDEGGCRALQCVAMRCGVLRYSSGGKWMIEKFLWRMETAQCVAGCFGA